MGSVGSPSTVNALLMPLIVLMFVGGSIVFTYLILKFVGSSRIIGRYHKHIKKTMNLPEVKLFLASAKKPYIELDQTDKELIVIWRDEKSTNSIWVYVDKVSMDITKILRKS